MDPSVWLSEIDAAFTNDPNIDELGIVMSPHPPGPALVCVDHKLGLSMSIIKPLFKFCIIRFHSTLSDLAKGHLKLYESETMNMMNSLTRALLLVKGDLPLAFNVRKQLILNGTCLTVDSELSFLKMLFTKHPKSPTGWQHRRWCLLVRWKSPRTQPSLNQQKESVDQFEIPWSLPTEDVTVGSQSITPSVLQPSEMTEELELCRFMADVYPKNYYAWMHRLWLLQFMDVASLKTELDKSYSWLQKHVSDHCAVNHSYQTLARICSRRHFFVSPPSKPNGILPSPPSPPTTNTLPPNPSPTPLPPLESSSTSSSISTDQNDKSSFQLQLATIFRAFEDNRSLIRTRPGNETLWYQRRSLVEVYFSSLRTFFSKTSQWQGVKLISLMPKKSEDNSEVGDVSHNLQSSSDETENIFKGFELKRRIFDCFTTRDDNASVTNEEEDENDDDDEDLDRINQLKKDSLLNKLLIASIAQAHQPVRGEKGQGLVTEEAEQTESTRSSRVLAMYLKEWIQQEIAFCIKCASNKCAWNFEKQRLFSIRYCAFLIYSVILSLCQPERSEKGTSIDDRMTLRQIYDTFSGVFLSCDQNVNVDYPSLLSSLMVGLQDCCEVLLAEDSHKALWRYLLSSMS